MHKVTYSDLAADLSDSKINPFATKEEKVIRGELHRAINQNNHDEIRCFESFGSEFGYQLANAISYRIGLNLGFSKFRFDSMGLQEKAKFLNQEEISLKIKSDNHHYNKVIIGETPNGSWFFSFSTNERKAAGGCGCICGLDIANKRFDNKLDCINEALNFIKSRHKESILKNHSVNSYCEQVISLINIKLHAKSDYSITNKMQIMLF